MADTTTTPTTTSDAASYTPVYPTYSNSYGIGTGTGTTAATPASTTDSTAIDGSASNPSYASEQVTVTAPDTSSRGFNPWSLTGEANARGK